MEDATYIWATSADSTGMVGDQKGYVLCDYMDLWNRERKVNYNLELKWREMWKYYLTEDVNPEIRLGNEKGVTLLMLSGRPPIIFKGAGSTVLWNE